MTGMELLVAFLMLGLVEAVIKPIAMRVVQWKIVKLGSVAMRYIDLNVDKFVHMEKKDIEHYVRQYMEGVTGMEWTDKDLDQVFRMHDCRKVLEANRERMVDPLIVPEP